SGIAGILGLAYKPHTDVTEASQGLLLAQALMEQGVETVVYDPVALENARKTLHGRVQFAASAAECVQQSDVVVIITPWDEFKHLPPELLVCHSTPRVIVDCWRILEPERYQSVAEYIPLGVGSQV